MDTRARPGRQARRRSLRTGSLRTGSLRTGIAAGAALAAAAGAGYCLPGLASAAAVPAPMAPALAGAARGGAVIVVLRDQHTGLSPGATGGRLRAAARADQAGIVSSIRASHGTGLLQLAAPSSVAATVSAAEVGRLRRDPAVARIIPDPKVAMAPAAPAPQRLVKKVAVPRRTGAQTCPFNPAGPARPLQEPEADTDIRASDGSPAAPDMGNSIATGTGVVVANEGMNELAGNPNFTRPDGSHVVIDAPSYTANDSNDEFYGDASSIAAQGTVNYQYSGALPLSGISPGCSSTSRATPPAPRWSTCRTPPSTRQVQTLAQVVSGIDNAVAVEHADVISESFGAPYIPGTGEAQFFYATDDAAVAAGVTVVASSGDSGDSGTVVAPSSDPLVIAAGAVDNFRLVAMDDGFRRYVSNNMAALSSGGTTADEQAGRPGRAGLVRRRGGLRGRQRRLPAGLPDRVDARHQRVGAADRRRGGRRDPGLPGHPRRRQPDAGPGQGDPDQHGERHRRARRPAGRRAAERLRRRAGGPAAARQHARRRPRPWCAGRRARRSSTWPATAGPRPARASACTTRPAARSR